VKVNRAGIFLVVLSVLLASCASGGQTSEESGVSGIGEGEGQVDIIAWAGIERGDTDPNYDWVTDLKPRQAKVNVKSPPPPMRWSP
jgi:putative spermidine/putrescine transport system substrate-binding protein